MFKNKCYHITIKYSYKGYIHTSECVKYAKFKFIAKHKIKEIFKKHNVKIININAYKSNDDTPSLKGNAER